MNRDLPSHDVSRRDFVKIIMTTLGTIMTGILSIPAIGYLISPAARKPERDAWIALGPLGNYPIGILIPFNFTRSTINGWEKTVNSYGVFVARQNESQIRVFSNICTHLSCRVSWHTDQRTAAAPAG
jgi:Rieske Fe-S protein